MEVEIFLMISESLRSKQDSIHNLRETCLSDGTAFILSQIASITGGCAKINARTWSGCKIDNMRCGSGRVAGGVALFSWR